MRLFLAVWLAGWTAACVGTLFGVIREEGGGAPSLLTIAVLWTAEFVVAVWAAYVFFARRTYRLFPDRMAVNTDCFFWHRTCVVDRKAIRQVKQIEDGGEGDDSFPSWGLSMVAEKRVSLVYRQPYETSHWLGRIVAQWADVPFIEADPPKT